MSAILAGLAAAKPGGMFFSLFPKKTVSLISQAARLKALEGVKVIGGAATLTRALLALPESEGPYFTAPDPGESGNINQATGRSAAKMLAALEATFGGPPTSAHRAHGNDATTLLLSAIEQVAVRNGETLSIGCAALRDALDAAADFQGLIGVST